MKVLNETAEEADKTINTPKAEERGEGGFFLTGVNVGNNKEVEDY